MKIVNFEEFVRMPAGTIFAPYKPCAYMEPFAIKVDTGGPSTDWFGRKFHYFNGVMPLSPNLDEEKYNFDCGYGTYETAYESVDNSVADYQEYSMFAILEKHEVRRLIDILEWALKGCEGGEE